MWCTFNEQNMSKKECDTAWDYEINASALKYIPNRK